MRALMTIVVLLAVGCHGPLRFSPMVTRPEPETQATIDESWENMLRPADRLERTLLLDVVLVHQFYQYGVDRLHMVSEKEVSGGRVIMEVRYDRERPLLDEFAVTYVDRHGREMRRERFDRDEVEERLRFLHHHEPCASCEHLAKCEHVHDEDETCECERCVHLRAVRQRHEDIMLATRPAD